MPPDTAPGSAPLPTSDLRWSCDPARFTFATTAEVEEADLLTHQGRAVDAIKLSLGMSRLDYNVYVSGPSGLGKTRTITQLVREAAALKPPPSDWVYVYDFQAPDRPRALSLPAGQGRKFASSLQAAIDRLGEDIGQVLHSAPLTRRRQALVEAYDHRREALVQKVQTAATERGFELNRTMLGPFGLALNQEEDDLLKPLDPRLREKRSGPSALEDAPLMEAAPGPDGAAAAESSPTGAAPASARLSAPAAAKAPKAAKAPAKGRKAARAEGDAAEAPAEADEATDAELVQMRERRQQVLDELGEVLWQLQKVSEETNRKLDALQREAAQQAVAPVLRPLKKTWAAQPEVLDHLAQLKDDILDNLQLFLQDEEEGEEGAPVLDPTAGDGLGGSLRRYYANVVIDRTGLTGAPVVAESHPTYANLLGRIEQEAHQGTLSTHFLMIKGGALHRAIGGFLILRAEDVLREPTAWEALKRAIRDGEIRLEDPNEGSGAFTTRWLKPGGIPLEGTRIILTGTEETLEVLIDHDLDFAKLFKVVAQFDDAGPREELLRDLPGFVRSLCDREGLKHLDPGAVAALAELAVRDAEDKFKLSTRQVVVSDVVREAEFWARQRGGDRVTAEDVGHAHVERQRRVALTADRIHESIARGQLLLDLKGSAVGQLNALVVSQVGPEIAFGWPSRMTARVGVGDRGVLAIEREVEMSGPIFSKGVLIIEGYLRGMYARATPLSVVVSVVMEQGYTLIEGDSASACELVTVLSAVGEVPVSQSIAVTGAVDQRGQMLPVGGINEKVEGMFRACQETGGGGRPGVIIPKANIDQLQLAPEVVAACAQRRFAVWAVDHIDAVIELLTGAPASRLHAEVQRRLDAFSLAWRDARVR